MTDPIRTPDDDTTGLAEDPRPDEPVIDPPDEPREPPEE